MSRTRALWLMVAVLLVAAMLRLPQLEDAPPGLHYDEAANAILAADIGLRGEHPVFIPSYTGKEVLFFYAAGALMRAIGPSILALRLTAALLALLTVAASYWLGRELLADRRVAVIASALIAASFWHLLLSRLGFRAISQPLLQALAMATLFHGLKASRKRAGPWRWFVLSGVFLGLTAYTYLAARLFPTVVLLALLPLLLTRQNRRNRWISLATTGGVAFIVVAPLLAYFVQNPAALWVRVAQVGPDGSAVGQQLSVLDGYLRSLGMFFLAGDPYWRFNLPGRPLFNWFWGGLLLVGWVASLLRWRRWWYDWQKAAVLLLITVPLIMILPTALATREIVPSNLRAIGLIPFIFYLPALGLVTLIEQLADLVRPPDQELGAFLRYLSFLEGYDVNYTFVVLLILLLGGAFTWRSYFEEWSTRTDLFYDSDGDLVALATYLDKQAPPDVPLFVAARHFRHPTLAFLSENYDRIKWLTGGQALTMPQEGPAQYIYPHSSPAPDWALDYLDSAERTVGPEGPDGKPLYVAFLLETMPNFEEDAATGRFDDLLRPLWYETQGGDAGEDLAVDFAWRVLKPGAAGLRAFAQLYDIWGNRWGQTELLSYAPEQWQTGDVVMQRLELPVAAGAPPGPYELRLGFFYEDGKDGGRRVPHLDGEGRFAGDALIIKGVPVAPGTLPVAPPRPPRGRPQNVRQGLELLGYSMGTETVSTGETLPLSLWWWATAAQPRTTLRLELLRSDNTGVILLDTQPVHGTYPFENWQTPLFLRDVIDPRIPVNLAAGGYRLHLRLIDADGDTVFTASLGTVSVQATDRTFDPPPVQYPLAATFAGEIELLGYDLENVAPRQFRLQLVWRALREIENDYTVFVHVLQADGTCCLWQNDSMPRQGAYPTSRWLAGEVVVDQIEMDLGSDTRTGLYPLEVGLYVPETGQRLSVEVPRRETGDALLLQPLETQ